MITCRSAAKINLSLDILALRPDGYHELQSIAHTIGLWDELAFDFDAKRGISLGCNRTDLSGEDNLCLKAVRAWKNEAQQHGVELPNLHIELIKNIPSGAGLGGGSGNAAATLLALNSRFDDLLDDATLVRLATRLGADVPFFLRGGCALFEGIGERLTALPLVNGWVTVVQPEQSLSTAAVFQQWDALGHESLRGTAAVQRAVLAGDLPAVGGALSNDMRIAAQACGVDIEAVLAHLNNLGTLGVEMTGSGSAVFALFEAEDAARNAAQCFQEQQVPGIHFVESASLCAHGVVFKR